MWHRRGQRSPSGRFGSSLSENASTQFSATTVVVWYQTGKSSSTTMVFLPAVFLLQLHLDHCSAQTDGRGQIAPMCPLRGRGGHWHQAPREPGCRMKVKTKTWDDEWQNTLYFCMICHFTRSYLKINALISKQTTTEQLVQQYKQEPTLLSTKSTRPARFMLGGR